MRHQDESIETIDFNKAKLVATYQNLDKNIRDREDVIAVLGRRLQTSLDVKKLVSIFVEETQKLVPFDQFTYEHDEIASFSIGKKAGPHACQFNLKLDQNFLGSIKITRKKKFLDEELAIVEKLAGSLVFPLNNAKLYHTALQSALKDELTGLGNKRALYSSLHREAERAVRHNKPLSVIMLDLDHFKQINDTFGHLAGDHVLRAAANAIKTCSRQSDLCFRYGGEEFLIVVDETDAQTALQICERIRQNIETQAIYFGQNKIPVTASFGSATYRTGEALETLVSRADKALYSAKEGGRNCSVAEDLPLNLSNEDKPDTEKMTQSA